MYYICTSFTSYILSMWSTRVTFLMIPVRSGAARTEQSLITVSNAVPGGFLLESTESLPLLAAANSSSKARKSAICFSVQPSVVTLPFFLSRCILLFAVDKANGITCA